MARRRDNPDRELKAALSSQLRASLGWDSDELSSQRAEAWQYYEGDLSVQPAPSGRSKVMSRDVLETVEALMPSLVRVFLGTEKVFRFEAQNPEDEKVAEQATDYMAWIMKRGDHFQQMFDWMKSPLIHKYSVIKAYWEERETTATEEFSGLTEEEMADLVSDEAVEVIEQAERFEEIQDPMSGMVLNIPVYDLKIARLEMQGDVVLEAIPPEEFLVNRRARTLEDALFVAHRTKKSRTQLLDMGYTEEQVEELSPTSEADFSEEADERFDDVDFAAGDEDFGSEDSRRYWIYECFIWHDYDGDGRAERRRVVVGNGPDKPVILENDESEDLPFAGLTPVPLPHRLIGFSMEDLSREAQRWKTGLLRIMNDGLYHSTMPRLTVAMDGFDLDYLGDLLNQAPGGIIRTKTQGAVQPLPTSWDGQRAFGMLQYIDDLNVRRTGVMPMGPDLQPDTLQPETAAKVQEDGNRNRERVELITRVYAETGFRQLARIMLRLIVRHQDKPRMIKLRNEWIPMDPRGWNIEMDVKPNVGLGTGNRDQQMQRYMMVAQKQEQILMTAGPQNPLVSMQNYYNTLSKMVEAADLSDPDLYFTDPSQQQQGPQQPPKPDPKMAEAQAKMQLEQQKAQAEMALKQQQAQASIEQSRAEAEMKMALMREEMAARLEIERQKLAMMSQLKAQEQQAEAELEVMKMATGAADGQGNVPSVV